MPVGSGMGWGGGVLCPGSTPHPFVSFGSLLAHRWRLVWYPSWENRLQTTLWARRMETTISHERCFIARELERSPCATGQCGCPQGERCEEGVALLHPLRHHQHVSPHPPPHTPTYHQNMGSATAVFTKDALRPKPLKPFYFGTIKSWECCLNDSVIGGHQTSEMSQRFALGWFQMFGR